MLGIICLLLTLYMFAIFGGVLLSWFPLNPSGAMATVQGFLFTVTDPVMGRVRRMVPTARFGNVAFDFSPIIVIFAIAMVQRVIC